MAAKTKTPHNIEIKCEPIVEGPDNKDEPYNPIFELTISFNDGELTHGNRNFFTGLLDEVFNLAETEITKIKKAGDYDVAFKLNTIEVCSTSMAQDEHGVRNFETRHEITIVAQNTHHWPETIPFNLDAMREATDAITQLERQLAQATRRIGSRLPKIIEAHRPTA